MKVNTQKTDKTNNTDNRRYNERPVATYIEGLTVVTWIKRTYYN